MKKNIKTILILAALIPVFIHEALVLYAIVKNSYKTFEKFDLLIFVVLTLYLGCLFLFRENKEQLVRLILITYSLILSIFLCEQYLRLKPEAYIPWPRIHRISYAATGVMPGIDGKIELSVNNLNLRGPEVDIEKKDIRILVAGGSTAECLYVSDKLTWPWRLQDKLADRLGKKVFVGNAGRSGHFTLNHMELLRNYRWANKFDWVIMLVGINDMGTLLRRNYEIRSQANIKTVSARGKIYYRDMKLFAKCRNAFLNYFCLETVLQDPSGRWFDTARQMRKKALENRAIDRLPEGLDESVRVYKSNLKKIIDMCKVRDQKLLMLTQPSMWRKDLPPDLEELLWQHNGPGEAYTTEALGKILDVYNSALIEVCRQEGIPYVDLASMLPKDTSVFYDGCHYNISGCEMIAEILAKEMTAIYQNGKNASDPKDVM
ncbi:MAG: SGNH/GDSL hydrolase family protein [Candidatus Omnitrophica bacterium]|nr:SGNH/GDSL hydrolase family protein [Candidatus Omnitrophota bacterium]